MKIQLLRENLQQAVGVVGKFATQKSQLPILAHVAIQALDEGIYMSGTDLEMGVRLRVGGKVVEKGELGVPAKILGELVQTLPLGTVELSVGQQQLLVMAGPVKAKLSGMNLADFPQLSSDMAGGIKTGEFLIGDLEWALDRADFAVSRDESRPVLTGLLWDFKKQRLVVTDGYRLSVVEGERFAGGGDEKSPSQLIISGNFMREVIRVAKDYALEKIKLWYFEEKKQVCVKGGEVLLLGRILEGEFPKYEAILPGSVSLEARVDRAEMLQAVRAVAIFAQDSAHIIKFQFEEAGLTISANTPQVGENQVEVPVEYVKPGQIMMAFNSKYLTDFLSHATTEQITIGVNEPLKPGVFREVGNDGYRHVIMPVRVRGEE